MTIEQIIVRSRDFNGWEITQVCHWFHCRKKGWEPVWFHWNEVPRGSFDLQWLKTRLP